MIQTGIGLARFFSMLLLIALLIGCEEGVPDGRIRVKNDSQDKSFNVVVVAAGGVSHTLNPKESALLPRGATFISFSRAYKDYTRRYSVTCPSNLKSGITIKLIDVHLNRMPGGCVTTSASP